MAIQPAAALLLNSAGCAISMCSLRYAGTRFLCPDPPGYAQHFGGLFLDRPSIPSGNILLDTNYEHAVSYDAVITSGAPDGGKQIL